MTGTAYFTAMRCVMTLEAADILPSGDDRCWLPFGWTRIRTVEHIFQFCNSFSHQSCSVIFNDKITSRPSFSIDFRDEGKTSVAIFKPCFLSFFKFFLSFV